MADSIHHLLSEEYDEPPESHGRETFLVSVLTHIAVIGFLLAHPEILFSPPKPVLVEQPQELTQLVYQPPPRQQPLQAPALPKPAPPAPPSAPAEPAQPRAQPGQDALREPPQPRRTPPPAPAAQPRAQQPAQSEPEQPPQRDLLAERRGGGGGERFARGEITPGTPEAPELPRDSSRRPGMEVPPLPKESPPASVTLPPLGVSSRGTDALLREMARQRASGQGSGNGLGMPGSGQGAADPNFNLPGPQILSDTMGVDFDPYLLRVYLAVRRNWYSVIPEIARLGKRGRVVLQFHILRNGGVQRLVLEDPSGTPSMDAAAMSSIRLSDPFPPLPAEFPGADIRLRFVYFYNMSSQ
jgi:TonB family protein